MTKYIFSVDFESIGLYGDPFAFGYVLCDVSKIEEEQEIENGYFACDPDKIVNIYKTHEELINNHENRVWIKNNVLPYLPKEYNCENSNAVCEKIYSIWMRIRSSYQDVDFIVDCGFPVEIEALRRSFVNKLLKNQLLGPYPLEELATALKFTRISREDHPRNEANEVVHHPTGDARYSARLYRKALEKAGLV